MAAFTTLEDRACIRSRMVFSASDESVVEVPDSLDSVKV